MADRSRPQLFLLGADITYIRLQEESPFLAIVLDAFSGA